MTNKTTDQAFKKTHQVVGANGNQLVDNLNEKIMKDAPGHDGVRLSNHPPLKPSSPSILTLSTSLLEQNVALEQSGQQRTHNQQIERDLEHKGYSTRQTDQEAALDAELKKKLDKRGNEAQ